MPPKAKNPQRRASGRTITHNVPFDMKSWGAPKFAVNDIVEVQFLVRNSTDDDEEDEKGDEDDDEEGGGVMKVKEPKETPYTL